MTDVVKKAIEQLERISNSLASIGETEDYTDIAIQALEQQPCEDAISREAVKYYIQAHIHEIISESGVDKNAHTNRVLRMIINGIETMPSIGYKESEADDK